MGCRRYGVRVIFTGTVSTVSAAAERCRRPPSGDHGLRIHTTSRSPP
jgi:hypothetical protein